MPRHLSVATIEEVSRIASPIAFVAMLEIDVIDPVSGVLVETLRQARNTEDIVWHNETYVASSFDFDSITEINAQPQITLTCNDLTGAIQARMQEYGGGIGFEVRIIIVNTGNLNQPPEMVEPFSVTYATAKDYQLSFTLGAENPLTFRFPGRRQFRDYCNFRYMGARCGYAGPMATCDYTLNGGNGCLAHNNIERFGAFSGIGINSTGV